MTLEEQIPGLREAARRERELRERAFLGAVEPIAGIEMSPLTLERLNLLMLAGNAYVCGGAPTAGDAAAVLWVGSAAFRPGDLEARDRFVRRIARLPVDEVEAGVLGYLDTALFDLVGDGAGASGKSSGRQPVVSWVASIVDTIASEYGWARRDIMTCPLAELAQYLRRIELRQGGKPGNPLSDKAKTDWLAQQNAHVAKN